MYLDPYTFFTTPSDEATFRWIDIFVQGSFYPIFAFLFGYGINMQYEKAIERNRPFAKIMAKRLTILLGFRSIACLIYLVWRCFIYLCSARLFTYFIRSNSSKMACTVCARVVHHSSWITLFHNEINREKQSSCFYGRIFGYASN